MQFQRHIFILIFVHSLLHATAQAAHPLVTEDAGVQGHGKHQVEFNADQLSQQNSSSNVSAMAYTYGVTDKFDLFAVLPATWSAPSGINDAAIGGKYLFADDQGKSWALKTEFVFPSGNAAKGLSNNSHDLALTLVRSVDLAPWSIHNNLALTWHRYQQIADQSTRRELVWRASVAVQFALTTQWQVMADFGLTQADVRDDRSRPVYALVGLKYSPNSSFDVDVGIKQQRIQGYNERQIGIGLTAHY